MDMATIGILGGMMAAMMTAMIAVIIYLDRSRRSDMNAGFARIDERLDRLTAIVVELVMTVGELKGRMETATPVEARSEAH